MVTWQTENKPNWKTKNTGGFQTANPITWFKRLKNAIWDALGYLWDDLFCTWDAVSDSDLWNVPGSGTWYIKN